MQRSGREKTRSSKRKSSSTSRSKTPYRKRVYALANYSAPTNAVAAPSVGLGSGAKTVLKTVLFANVTPSAAGIYTATLRLGSCFNPLGTLSAIQPALFDQWKLIYSRYLVERAYVKVECSQQYMNVGATNYTFVVAGYPTTDSGVVADYQDAASQPWAQSLMCGPGDNTTSNTLHFNLDHTKVLGRKGPVDAAENGASVANNPPTASYMLLQLFIQNAVASTNPLTLRISVVQHVHFDQRNPLGDD